MLPVQGYPEDKMYLDGTQQLLGGESCWVTLLHDGERPHLGKILITSRDIRVPLGIDVIDAEGCPKALARMVQELYGPPFCCTLPTGRNMDADEPFEEIVIPHGFSLEWRTAMDDVPVDDFWLF